jgi:membrane-associated phospholipid phosphatase
LAALAVAGRNPENSPFVFSWQQETALLATGLAGHFIGQHRLVSMAPPTGEDLRREDLAPWDRFAAGWYSPPADWASEVLVFAVGGSMLYADAWHAARGAAWTPFWEDALMLGEALAWSAALNLNTRAFRLHPRPLAYASDAPARDRAKPEAAGSFYSGHASAAFLGAAYLATAYPLRHPEFRGRAWLWGGGLAAAGCVAASRVAAGKHFPSDVLAGAAVGVLLGWVLPRLHRNSMGTRRAALRLRPESDGFGIQAVFFISGQSRSGDTKMRPALSASRGREK